MRINRAKLWYVKPYIDMEVSNRDRQTREQLLESKIAFENHICLVAASNVVCQSLLDSMNPEFDFQNGILNSIYRQYTQEDT